MTGILDGARIIWHAFVEDALLLVLLVALVVAVRFTVNKYSR